MRLGVATVVALGVLIVVRGDAPDASSPGTLVDAELTLITSDRHDVSCMSPKMAGRFACEFVDATTPRKLDERDTLRPYMTVGRQMYLIPGLFLDPHIARRYQSEPPDVPRETLRRFTAKCQLKLGGHLDGFALRWAATGPWSEPQNADIASVVACQVHGDAPPARQAAPERSR